MICAFRRNIFLKLNKLNLNFSGLNMRDTRCLSQPLQRPLPRPRPGSLVPFKGRRRCPSREGGLTSASAAIRPRRPRFQERRNSCAEAGSGGKAEATRVHRAQLASSGHCSCGPQPADEGARPAETKQPSALPRPCAAEKFNAWRDSPNPAQAAPPRRSTGAHWVAPPPHFRS